MSTATRTARGALSGLAGGLAAAWLMSAFQRRFKDLGGADEGAPATHKAADDVSRAVRGKRVAARDKAVAGNAVHYATGAGTGALYGILARLTPHVTTGFGTAYAAALELALDQGLVPALGWSKSPKRYSPRKHAFGLASHLVFGVALEACRRMLDGRRPATAAR